MDIHRHYLQEFILPRLVAHTKTLPVVEKKYRIGGKHILAKYYTHAFADRCLAALCHNEVDDFLSADLTIHVVDTPAMGGEIFGSPDRLILLDRAANQHLDDNGVKGIFFLAEKTLTVYDQQHQQGYLWTSDATKLPHFFMSAPARTLLHWFFSKEKMFLVHGAALSSNGNAALLTARGGSGKSTTALAWLVSGQDYLGDDYALIEPGAQTLVHSIYNSIKVAPETLILPHFASLKPDIYSKGEKSTLFLQPKFFGQIKNTAILKMIMIPVISGRKKTIIIPATKGQAIIALAPTAVLQLPLASTETLQRMKEVVMNTPCYILEMSSDSMEVAFAINEFLQTA
jgi:hypothetical protein